MLWERERPAGVGQHQGQATSCVSSFVNTGKVRERRERRGREGGRERERRGRERGTLVDV